MNAKLVTTACVAFLAGVLVHGSSRYSIEILQRDDERIVTPMMPCRVSVYETRDGTTYVARMNSGLVGGVFGGVINEVMQKASAETEAFIRSVVN